MSYLFYKAGNPFILIVEYSRVGVIMSNTQEAEETKKKVIYYEKKEKKAEEVRK